MERWSKYLLVAGLTLVPVVAHAQVFGQWTSARMLEVNGHNFGAQLELSHHVFGPLANLRLSLYPNVDFGFQGGLSRIQIEGGNIATARLGADFRFGVMRVKDSRPLDMALGAFIGLESGDRLGRLVIGPSVVASHGIDISGKERMIPYIGLQARYTQFEFRGVQRNDFSVPLRIGSQFPIVQGFRAGGEVEMRLGDDIDDDTAFGVSVEFDI